MIDVSFNPDQLLTEKEAAALICYTPRALQNWRLRGGGPEYVKIRWGGWLLSPAS